MISSDEFIAMALGFPGCDTYPHFDRLAFRAHKKIFATLHADNGTANCKLSPENQYVYTRASKAVAAVSGGWGRMGWTTVDLNIIEQSLLLEVLTCAYHHAATKKRKTK